MTNWAAAHQKSWHEACIALQQWQWPYYWLRGTHIPSLTVRLTQCHRHDALQHIYTWKKWKHAHWHRNCLIECEITPVCMHTDIITQKFAACRERTQRRERLWQRVKRRAQACADRIKPFEAHRLEADRHVTAGDGTKTTRASSSEAPSPVSFVSAVRYPSFMLKTFLFLL